MRRLIGFMTLATLVVAATPFAAADHSAPCPEYTLVVGDERVGVAANEDGQAAVRAAEVYVFVDELGGVTGEGQYLFSIWFYPETNGEPGAQRHDDYCTTPGTDGSTRDGWYSF